jgi:hypothetical protein
MYLTRTYTGGAADHDPRQITWAVFHCDVCNKNEEVNVTRILDTFQFNAPRKCPHCKCLGKNDRAITLKREIETLTASRANIDIMIEQLTEQLNSLTSTEVSNNAS